MALYPAGDKLDEFASRYVLANLAARRAKQIRDGAPVLIQTTSTHPLTIALEEIAEGAVRPVIIEEQPALQPAETLDSIDLLAREASGMDTGLGDLGALLGGEAKSAGADASLGELASLNGALIDEPTSEFEDEVSLAEVLEQEHRAEAEENEEEVWNILAEAGSAEETVEEELPE